MDNQTDGTDTLVLCVQCRELLIGEFAENIYERLMLLYSKRSELEELAKLNVKEIYGGLDERERQEQEKLRAKLPDSTLDRIDLVKEKLKRMK